jgi:hypothetical protein
MRYDSRQGRGRRNTLAGCEAQRRGARRAVLLHLQAHDTLRSLRFERVGRSQRLGLHSAELEGVHLMIDGSCPVSPLVTVATVTDPNARGTYLSTRRSNRRGPSGSSPHPNGLLECFHTGPRLTIPLSHQPLLQRHDPRHSLCPCLLSCRSPGHSGSPRASCSTASKQPPRLLSYALPPQHARGAGTSRDEHEWRYRYTYPTTSGLSVKVHFCALKLRPAEQATLPAAVLMAARRSPGSLSLSTLACVEMASDPRA